jgi:hypothetical protein
MTKIRASLIGLCVAIVSFSASAQGADEHKDHHPADSTPPAAAVRKPAPSPKADANSMAMMDKHMKAMQAMHEKMASAKTPEDRQALMAEHMKLMQDGMAMMKQMGGASGMGNMAAGNAKNPGAGDRQQMMEKRMDMMESMMQMMMDRMPPPSTK